MSVGCLEATRSSERDIKAIGCKALALIEVESGCLDVGVNIWICVLDYLNKTQDSRSFGAKPPCQDFISFL